MRFLPVFLVALTLPGAALAQDGTGHRYRVTLGAQLAPKYPGADKERVGPLISLARAKGDAPFAFAAADQSFSLALIDRGGIAFGPVANYESKRRPRDVGANVPVVKFTPELGGFVQAQVAPGFRLRGEARQGIGGHKGLIALIGADAVARDGDKYLFAIGPRLTLASDKYERAYFGIAPATTLLTGLPSYRAKGGVQAIGGTANALRQIGPHFGVTGFVKYDRLVSDAADSPLTRRFGSRDQFSGGLGLSYAFNR